MLPSTAMETAEHDLVELADEINREHDACVGAAADAVSHAIEAGRMLSAVRNKVGRSAGVRGSFKQWVEENCSFSYSQANNYIRVYEGAARCTFDNGSSHPESIRAALRMLADERETNEDDATGKLEPTDPKEVELLDLDAAVERLMQMARRLFVRWPEPHREVMGHQLIAIGKEILENGGLRP